MLWMRPPGWCSFEEAGWSGVDDHQFQGERWCMLRDEMRGGGEGGMEGGGREGEREGGMGKGGEGERGIRKNTCTHNTLLLSCTVYVHVHLDMHTILHGKRTFVTCLSYHDR